MKKMNILSKVLNFILGFIWKIFLGIGIIFAAISILINYLFVPKPFTELSQKFPHFFLNVLFSWKVTVFLLMLIIVSVGGFFVWQYFIGRGEVEEMGTQEMASDADISNWQIYHNEEYGFEVRYPPDYFVQERSYFSNEEIFGVRFESAIYQQQPPAHYPSMYITVVNTTLSPREWLDVNNDPRPAQKPEDLDPAIGYEQVEEITIAGMSAIRTKEIAVSDSSLSTIIEGSSGHQLYYIRAISSGLGEFPEETANKILSTFRFIKSNKTAGWQTYRNEEYGFEVRYPAEWEVTHEGIWDVPGAPFVVELSPTSLGVTVASPISISVRNKGIEEAMTRGEDSDVVSEEKIVIGGVTGTKRVSYSLPGGVSEHIFIPKGEDMTFLLTYFSREDQDIFYQILSTFQFME